MSLYSRLRHKLTANPIVKNIVILATGSGVAQIFPLIASVFIARLYTPSDLGLYALYFSLASILNTVVCLGYESTIYLSKNEILSNNAVVLCSVIALLLSAAMTVLLLFLPNALYRFLGMEEIVKYFPLIFLSLISSVCCTILTTRFNRQGSFKFLSKMKIFLALSSSIVQISFGFMSMHSLGLILSNIIAYLIADIIFLYFWIVSDFFSWQKIKKKYIVHIFWRYRNFSLYMTPSGIISSVATQLPNFLLMRLFGETVVGFYSFGQKLIVYPIGFIVTAIQDVFRKESTAEHIEKGNCINTYNKTFRLMVPFAIVALLGFMILSPFVFKVAFGEQWTTAATFVQITCLFFIVQAMSSILSFSIILAEKQRKNLLFLLILLISTFLSYYLTYRVVQNPFIVLAVSTIIGSVCYLWYMRFSYNCSK